MLKIKVAPYYIFNCKKVEGIRHFRTSIQERLNIMEHLRGYTSGLAVPTYIITALEGRGKTPIVQQYLMPIFWLRLGFPPLMVSVLWERWTTQKMKES